MVEGVVGGVCAIGMAIGRHCGFDVRMATNGFS